MGRACTYFAVPSLLAVFALRTWRGYEHQLVLLLEPRVYLRVHVIPVKAWRCGARLTLCMPCVDGAVLVFKIRFMRAAGACVCVCSASLCI